MKRSQIACFIFLLMIILSACDAPTPTPTLPPFAPPTREPTFFPTLTPTSAPPSLTPVPPALLYGHTDNIQDIAFSPDGKMFASTSCKQKNCLQSEVRLWDISKPGAFAQIGSTLQTDIQFGKHLAFSHNGKILALGGCNNATNSICTQGIIRLWDVSNLSQVAKSINLVGHPSAIHSLIFSPDDKTLISASSPQMTVIIWNLSTINWDTPDANSPAKVSETTTIQVVSAQEFSPDGKLLVSSDSTNNISLWDMSDTKSIAAFGESMKGHQDAVFSLALSPDGKLLASGGLDNTIILWDVANPKAAAQLSITPQEGFAQCLSFSPDGKYLASCINKSVILWDVSAPKKPVEAGELYVSIYVNSAAYSPDGMTLASGGAAGDLAVWDLRNLKTGNLPHRLVSTATITPSNTATFGPPATLTPYPSMPAGETVYSHPQAPTIVFIYDSNVWQLDVTPQNIYSFLKHRSIPDCRIDFASLTSTEPTERIYMLRIGKRNWGVNDYKNGAVFWQNDIGLNLYGFTNLNCRRDQEIVLLAMLTRSEYAGGPTITEVPTATPRPPIAGFDCPGAKTPRLAVGDIVTVIADTVWLMTAPLQDEKGRITGYYKYDPSFIQVTEGPVCKDGYVYWKVIVKQSGKNNPDTGWLTESHGDEYYLEPYYQGW